MKRILLIATCSLACLLAFGLMAARERMGRCAPVPLLTQALPLNGTFAVTTPGDQLPAGWSAAAPGALLRGPAVDGQGFDLDGDGRALQLVGIANHLSTPPIAVTPGAFYCVGLYALSDTGAPTRARPVFVWHTADDQVLGYTPMPWQTVALWTPAAPPRDWAHIAGSARAPVGAAFLRVQIEPAADDRIYLDGVVAQQTLWGESGVLAAAGTPAVQVLPWPAGARAAVSFSFDWETTMGGLIHSRSLDDPYADVDPELRGLRMRAGITTTLQMFAAYDIRGTYYANGYNFLDGNLERRTFMSDPTFAWATRENGWQTDIWPTTRWFAPDPFGTVESHPGWYFGDLIAPLRATRQDIQSHTFSHLYAGLAAPSELRTDAHAWNTVAAEQRVAPARSLAFPWSSSAGMRDAAWHELVRAGITSVTRTNWNPRLPQYHLVDAREPHCRPVPAHPSILACPDFYVTEQRAMLALEQVDRVIAAGGALDFWTHTEEVVSPGQIAAWRSVVRYAAERRNSGELWIVPLRELAARQQATAQVQASLRPAGAALRLTLTNASTMHLDDLTLRFAMPVGRIGAPDDVQARLIAPDMLLLDLRPGQRVEVLLWPA